MKKLIAFLVFLPIYLFSQQTDFNLKGIVSLDVMIKDQQSILNDVTHQNIITETKLKLKSAGIELRKDSPDFIISVNKITTNNLAVWIRVEENQELKRGNEKINSTVISYSDIKFHNIGLLGDYNRDLPKFIDNQLNGFIDLYLNQNE